MSKKKLFEDTTLTVDGINDFMVCELFYECRHKRNEPEVHMQRDILADRFENTLKKVAAFFFYKKQSGNVPSYNALLNRWEKLWFPKDMTAYDLAIEQHETTHGNIASFSNIAAASLEHFHNKFADDAAIPIMIDEEFVVPLDRETRLKGSFDILLKDGDSYRIIKWHGRRHKPKSGSMLLDFAALKYAFDYKSEKSKRVTYHLYNLTASSGGFIKMDPPVADDVYALKYWARQIVKSESFVPRRGFTAYCRGCPFDEICAEWNAWPTKETVS